MRNPLLTSLLLALSLLSTGCEEDVVSVLGTDRPFTLFGVFSPQLDTQWVRVYPITDVLELTDPVPLDAQFTTTDMETGAVTVWQDTILSEPNGLFAHAYYSPFVAAFGRGYDILIERPDGLASSVSARVPIFSELEQLEPSTTPATVPIRINAPVPLLFDVKVAYTVMYQLDDKPIPSTGRFEVDYTEFVIQEADGWLINIALWQDFSAIRSALIDDLNLSQSADITLDRMQLGLVVASEDWNPPGGIFDPEVLVQPGTFSNVDNGFGFVGAGYRLDLSWLPPDEVIEASGFVAPEEDENNPG